MKYHLIVLLWGVLICQNFNVFSQSSELYIPRNILQACEKGTRTFDGKPGPQYWQNSADYDIRVFFDPVTLQLQGEEKIIYYNQSPDTLKQLVLYLLSDFYKKGNARDYDIDPSDESDGIILQQILLNGNQIDLSPKSDSIDRRHSSLIIALSTPLFPSDSLQLDIRWASVVNRNSHLRTGAVDSSSCFTAYFYPRVAVYDDIDGWNYFKYRGETEFYNDFGNFQLSVTVPANFKVWATGQLQNAEDVLSPAVYRRYRLAWLSDTIVHIVDSTFLHQDKKIPVDKTQTWKFKAERVSDMAFATSDHYLWDASSLLVDPENGRRVLVEAAYNKHSEDYYNTAVIARKAVDMMSRELPGIPFPYPKITIFNGLDEMEYPMMVNLLSYADHHSSIRVTIHEIFHTYAPFYCGINETRYAWMDEGITTFATTILTSALDGPENARLSFYEEYLENAGSFNDLPLFITSDYLKKPIYNIIYYTKTAAFLLVLQDLLGEKLFQEALHEFMTRWEGRHPTPYDLFYTLMYVSGQDLNWLITPWFFEFGYVDLAIREVSVEGSSDQILIERIGLCPAPVHLRIIYADGETEMVRHNAAIWKEGKKSFLFNRTHSRRIKSIEILNTTLIEADMSNNFLNF
ncbi:MAG: M1 family metallopeptidase [bacterium]|nr:MAG: M1 family metallopeptidase [bacterium]